jgi:hypothetical protein
VKSGLKELVGLSIAEVIVAKNERTGFEQVFLVLDDGTYFEFWGQSWNCAGGRDSGGADAAVDYALRGGSTILARYTDSVK